jgi:hypothetical protein
LTFLAPLRFCSGWRRISRLAQSIYKQSTSRNATYQLIRTSVYQAAGFVEGVPEVALLLRGGFLLSLETGGQFGWLL